MSKPKLKTWYVDEDGNDENGDGSLEKPFLTYNHARFIAETDFPDYSFIFRNTHSYLLGHLHARLQK